MKRISGIFLVILLLAFNGVPSAVEGQNKDTLSVMFYNLLNFPTGGGSVTNREDTLKVIVDHVLPDIFLVCELVNSTGANTILSQAMNSSGRTYYAMTPFVSNQSTANNLQNLCFYNSDKLTLKSQAELTTDLRDINKYIFYYKDPNLALTNDTIWLDCYVTHLKASTGGTNETRRNLEITVLRDHLNAQPALRNSIFGADLNVYTYLEPAYQTITTTGTYPFQDPINRPAAWNNDAASADIHSQSTRTTSLGDGATGGMDDRFDQILVSSNIMTGADKVRYIPGTYKALGQDGLHFNLSLVDPPANVSEPAPVISALYYMSDHLPIVMDIEVTPTLPLPVTVTGLEAFRIAEGVSVQAQFGEPDPGLLATPERRDVSGNVERLETRAARPGQMHWDDLNAPAGMLWYRLEMTGINGEVSYSEWVAVDGGTSAQYAEWKEGGILLYSEMDDLYSLDLLDVSGRVLRHNEYERPVGASRMEVSTSGIPAGIYLIRLCSRSGNMLQFFKVFKAQ